MAICDSANVVFRQKTQRPPHAALQKVLCGVMPADV